MQNTNKIKKIVEGLAFIFLAVLFVFYFFHSRERISSITDLYLKHSLQDKSGLFASVRADNLLSERIDLAESFSGSKNSDLFEGDINKIVWRSIFAAERTGVYSFQAFSNGSMLVYIDGLLRLNLYKEGVFKNISRQLVLKKGHHTIRIVYRNAEKIHDPIIGFKIYKTGGARKTVEFIPVDIKGAYNEEISAEEISGRERSLYKVIIFVFGVIAYCMLFRRYFSYGYEFIFLFVFVLGYVFPDLYFTSSDEAKNMMEVLNAGCLNLFSDYVSHKHMLFYHYVDVFASFFGYRIEGVRFAAALAAGVTAVLSLKVFTFLFQIKKQNTFFFMQVLLWFSFFGVVAFMRFLTGGTTVNSVIFMFVLYICLKSEYFLSRGYLFIFLLLGGTLFGVAAMDNFSDFSFFISIIIASIFVRKIHLKDLALFACGFLSYMLFHLDWVISDIFSGNVFNTAMFTSLDGFKTSFCGCFSFEYIINTTDVFYLIHLAFFVLAFIVLFVLRYFVKRQHCKAIGFALTLIFCMIVFQAFFTGFHYDFNYFYVPMLLLLFVFSSMLYELFDSGKKGFVFVAYVLFSLMLVLNACSLYKFFRTRTEEMLLSKASVCSETLFYLDRIEDLYSRLLDKDITCIITEDKLADALQFADLPYGHFKIFTLDGYMQAKHNEHCKKLKKSIVSIKETSPVLEKAFSEQKDLFRISLSELV